jgi:hypothetical protein
MQRDSPRKNAKDAKETQTGATKLPLTFRLSSLLPLRLFAAIIPRALVALMSGAALQRLTVATTNRLAAGAASAAPSSAPHRQANRQNPYSGCPEGTPFDRPSASLRHDRYHKQNQPRATNPPRDARDDRCVRIARAGCRSLLANVIPNPRHHRFERSPFSTSCGRCPQMSPFVLYLSKACYLCVNSLMAFSLGDVPLLLFVVRAGHSRLFTAAKGGRGHWMPPVLRRLNNRANKRRHS